jgi:DNA mismatch repair protein MutS
MRSLSQHGQEQIDAYEQKLRQETGINSLKIKEHKTYGLLIEITKSNLARVPAGFLRRQTMVNNERFVTMELEELGESLASATEEAVRREAELYGSLLENLGQHQSTLKEVASAVALLDLLQSFATKALKERYVRPELSLDGELLLKACRHPVVERWVGQHAFMPNDIELSKKKKQLLITGPNMAGKSTVMRQTALASLLHQIGSFVPASFAKLPIFDRIFTRVGAADDLSRGQSTFMVEMAEAASILRQATENSLVILDEVGRGTSTQDGLAIAASILEYIGRQVRSYTLFATHYHELVPYSKQLSSVKVAQVEVLEDKAGIRFTHRLIDGASGSSFGVEVAKLAGIPDSVISAANRFLKDPEILHGTVIGGKRTSSVKESTALVPPLEAAFGVDSQDVSSRHDRAIQAIMERLERVNILRTTPMQALAILDEIKGTLEQRGPESLFPEETRLC